ncbi:MAG TPA: DUF4214 domain-containing protein [Pirellulales bacterium]|nr:DUF4214 domain-containing protein [Pirellulales bacterium]
MLQWTSRFGLRRSRRRRSDRPLPPRSKKSAGVCGPLERRNLLSIQGLEERVVLAWDMTLSVAATVNVSSNTAGGTTTFTATDTGANLSWQDVDNALSAGDNVVINSGSTGTEAGNITDTTGAQLSFAPANLSVTIASGSGAGLVGNISIENLNLAGTNSSAVLDAAGDVSTGLLSGGTFGSPVPLASASITAGGSISSQTTPVPGPVEATSLALRSASGINLQTAATNLAFANTTSGDVDITNTGALTITTVDGLASSTNAATGGNITLHDDATITISAPLSTAGGSITIDAPAIDITTAQDFGSANVTFVTSNLTVAAPLSGTGVLSFEAANDADNIDVNGTGAGLSLTAATLAELTGAFSKIAVGSATATGTITVDAATTFTAPIEFDQKTGGAGKVIIDGRLTAPGITINGSGDTTTLNADLVTAGAPIVIHDSVVLGSPATITLDTTNGGGVLAGAAITIDTPGTIDDDVAGSTGLVLNAGTAGVVTLSGAVGTVAAPKSLDVTGATIDLGGSSIATTGAQLYHDPVTMLAGATTLSSSGGGDITFDGALDGANTLTVSTSGTTTFDGPVGGTTALTSVSVTGAADLNGGAITTATTQSYGGATTLTADTTLNATTVTFASTLDSDATARTLTINGAATFDGVVGGTNALKSLAVTGAADLNGGAITTTTTQSYGGAVTLTADTTLNATTVTFASTLDSDATARALTINGAATFDGVVGGTNALKSLAVTGAADLNGGAITTTTTQSYGGAVTLTADTTLNATTVTFASTLDSDATARALTINGGATFDGVVGGTNALKSLSVTGAADLNGGAITTTTTQSYGGAVTLTADTTLNATTVTFASTLDSDATPRALTINGGATFDGAVGGTNALKSLAVTGAADLNGGAITTTTTQSYGGAVTLTADTTLNATTVTFASTLDSDATARTLTINGGATFDGVVGGTNALKSLAVTGAADLNGGAITTTTTQSYGGAVTLTADTTLNATTVTFASTLDSDATARTLTINGGATFDGVVGGTNALKSLAVTGAADLNGGAITTTTTQSYGGAVTLTADTTLNATTVTFASTLDSDATSRALTINGAATFDGVVGGTNALKSLAVTGAADLNGGAITTTTTQSYGGAVTLTADTTLNATTVTFASTLDSDATSRALTINAAAVFDGAVGGTHPLRSLLVTGTTALNGGLVDTTGSQTYDGAVQLGANDVLNVLGSNQNVTFNSTVQSPGTAFSLTIDTTGGLAAGSFGRVIFNGDVGGAGNPLASLSVTSGPFMLSKNVTTTGNIAVTVAESAPNNPGDDLLLTGATLTSTSGAITLEAADNLSIDAASTVTATAGTVTLRGDFNNNDTPAGTVVNLDGSINSPTINVFGGPGNDTINVQKTLAGTTMNINETAGKNTINVSSTAGGGSAGTLAVVQGTINVNGSGNDTLNLDDRTDTTSISGTLTATSVSGLGMGAPVNYMGLAQLHVLLGNNAALDFNVQSIVGSTSVGVQGQGTGTIDVGDSTNKLISKLDGIVGPLSVSNVHELNLNDAGSTRTDTLGSMVATYNIDNTAISRGAPGALPSVFVEYTDMGAGVIQVNGAATVKDVFDVFLPTFAQTPLSSVFQTLQLSGGAVGGGSVKVVAPQQNPAAAPPGFAYTAHVGTLGSGDSIQMQNVQSLYMYGSPAVSNNFSNDTSVSAIIIGGEQPDVLTGGTGPDVIFGGGTPLTGPGDLLTARSPGSFIFAELAPLFLPGGGFAYQQFGGNANTVINGGGGTVVSLTQGSTISNASTVLQNNAHIDVITWLTARFAPLGSIGAIEQQAQSSIQALAALQPPPPGPSPLPVAPVTPNSTAWQNYVEAAFHDVFGGASPAGLSVRVAQLVDMPRANFASDLVHSDEYYQDVVITPAYQKYLGRLPDAGGLAFWTKQMEAGLTDEELEAGFIGSDEFFTTQGGGTNAGWVDALYQKLLGRPADASGKAFWLAQLAAGESRAQVALGFTSSVEREEQRVTADYQTFLGRQPDQSGLNFWVSQFAQGRLTNEDVVAGFLASDEYFSKHS